MRRGCGRGGRRPPPPSTGVARVWRRAGVWRRRRAHRRRRPVWTAETRPRRAPAGHVGRLAGEARPAGAPATARLASATRRQSPGGKMRWPGGTSAPYRGTDHRRGCVARHADRLDSRSTAARVARLVLKRIQSPSENSVGRCSQHGAATVEHGQTAAHPPGCSEAPQIYVASRAAITTAGAADAAAADGHTPRRSWSTLRPHPSAVRCGLPGRRLVACRGARPAGRTPAPPQTSAAVSAAQRGYTGPLSPRRAYANRYLVWQRRGRVPPGAFLLLCLPPPPARLSWHERRRTALTTRSGSVLHSWCLWWMGWCQAPQKDTAARSRDWVALYSLASITTGGLLRRGRRKAPSVASTWAVPGGHARPPPSPPHSP